MNEGIVCFLVCFGSISQQTKIPLQTYCQSYVQTIQKKEELDELMRLPRHLRNRIQGNDLDYLCRCRNLKDKACQKE